MLCSYTILSAAFMLFYLALCVITEISLIDKLVGQAGIESDTVIEQKGYQSRPLE